MFVSRNERMIARPEATVVREFLTRAKRRVTLVASVEGAAAGTSAAFVATLVALVTRRVSPVSFSVITGVVIVAIFAIVRALERRARAPRVATLVERREPECRNLLITADELMSESRSAVALPGNDYVDSLVLRQAARLVGTWIRIHCFPRGTLCSHSRSERRCGQRRWRWRSVRTREAPR